MISYGGFFFFLLFFNGRDIFDECQGLMIMKMKLKMDWIGLDR